MNDLHKQAISFLQPGPNMIPKGGRYKLKQIMKFQGIDERQIQEAINEM